MSCALIRLSILGLVLGLIAGCGGSSSAGSGGGNGTGGGSGSPTPTAITFTFQRTAPTAVATQVGSGAFTAATLSSGQVALSLPDGTTNFAVAYVCPGFSPFPSFTQNQEYLKYASSLDGTEYGGACFSNGTTGPIGGNTPTGTLTGNVGIGPFSGASELFVWALAPTSGVGEPVNLAANGDFSFTVAPPGTDNIVLSLYDSSANALAVKSLSNQTIPGSLNNGNPVNFGAGDATAFQPITYVNVPAGYSIPSTNVSVDSKGLGLLLLQMNGSLFPNPSNQNLLTQYSTLPAGIAQSGDQYLISSTASKQLSSATSVVSYSMTLIGGGPATITFPQPWSYAGPMPAALPTVDFSYTGLAGQPGLSYSGNFQWTPTAGINDTIALSLTPNYQSVTPSVTVPDLSGIPGFLAPPASGATVSWSAQIESGVGPTSGSSSGTSNTPKPGVSSSGTYTAP